MVATTIEDLEGVVEGVALLPLGASASSSLQRSVSEDTDSYSVSALEKSSMKCEARPMPLSRIAPAPLTVR